VRSAYDPERSQAGSQSRNAAGCCHVSEDGPQKGAPVLVPAGMMGDRADVIFTSPDKISGFITHQC
jgi:cytochrome c